MIVNNIRLKVGWLGRAWVELDTQSAPRGELWIILIIIKMN